MDRVVVIGAGIAGLAVALALAQRGVAVEVREQAEAIRDVGAGIQISPNGWTVLGALGLAERLERDATRGEAVELCAASGARVVRMALGPGFRLLHRADLIGVLAEAAGAAGVRLLLGARVEAMPDPALVIGADGLHSVVRGWLNGAEVPFFTGQVAWRALIAGDGAEGVARVFMGPGCHLVSYPLRGGRLRNIVAVEEQRDWVDEGWSGLGDAAALRARFARFGGPVPGWLDQVGVVHRWGLFRHGVAPVWQGPVGAGRAVILGDAAHPTLPFLAQGANMALEDAFTLARVVAGGGDLAAWQALRRPRVARIVAAANANARAYHLSGPVAMVAHAGLRLVGAVAPGAMIGRYGWLYRHDVTEDGA